MAKKRLILPTDAQVIELGGRLLGTSRNVYHECKLRWGIEVEEVIFDRLAKLAKIGKCTMCDTWCSTDDMLPGHDGEPPDVCNACADG